MRLIHAAITLSAVFATVTPAIADDWSVVVIGNPTATATSAFADAYHAAAALEQVDGSQVYMFRDLDADETEAVLETALGQKQVIVYFSGEITGQPDQPILKGAGHSPDGVNLQSFVDQLAQQGTERLALLLETCSGQAYREDITLAVPSNIEMLLATSDAACGSQRLTTVLTANSPDTSLQNRLDGVQILSDTGAGITLTVAAVAAPTVSAPTSNVEVTRMVQDVVSILPATALQSGAVATITPAAFGTTIVPPPLNSEGATAALPAAVIGNTAALPQQDGRPEPSIIVGTIQPDAEFDEVDPNAPDVSGSEIAYDDLDARQSLRTNNPELFAGLVEAGAFDPPGGQIEFALQTELARMNCYRSGIDGIWGPGSRSSVDRYFTEAGGNAPTREPEAQLFRVIISQDDVACPTPVVVAPRPVAATASAPSAPRPQPSAPSAPAPQPAAPAPQPSGGGGLADVNLGGVFR